MAGLVGCIYVAVNLYKTYRKLEQKKSTRDLDVLWHSIGSGLIINA